MRNLRFVAAALLVLAFLLLSGCGKTYYFSFKEEQSLEDGPLEWLTHGGGTYSFFFNGVALDDKWLVCPYAFLGDATIEVTFEMNIEETESVTFAVIISHQATYPSSTFHGCSVRASSPGEQGAIISEKNIVAETRALWPGVIPGLDKHGKNVIKLVIKGDRYRFYLNGSILADYIATLYFPGWYYLQISGEIGTDTYEAGLVVKEVKVVYSGSSQAI